MTTAPQLADALLEELVQVLGAEHVLTSKTARYSRTRVPAPFPVHRWGEHVPDVVVMPGSTEEVAEVVVQGLRDERFRRDSVAVRLDLLRLDGLEHGAEVGFGRDCHALLLRRAHGHHALHRCVQGSLPWR